MCCHAVTDSLPKAARSKKVQGEAPPKNDRSRHYLKEIIGHRFTCPWTGCPVQPPTMHRAIKYPVIKQCRCAGMVKACVSKSNRVRYRAPKLPHASFERCEALRRNLCDNGEFTAREFTRSFVNELAAGTAISKFGR